MRKRDARKLVMGRWARYFAHQAQAYLLPAITYAKLMAQRATLSPEQQAQVRRMVEILEEAFRLFTGRITYRLVRQLERAHQRAAAAFINLSAWDDDATAGEFWAQAILGSSQDWVHLAEVATRPLLEGNANWTDKQGPVSYLAKAARYAMRDSHNEELPRKKEVSLEDAPEPQAPEPAPADASLEELVAAVLSGADPEVKEYGRLALEGCTHEEARRKLGWYKKRAHRVDVRYRRHLKSARGNSDLQALRQILTGWPTDASRSVRKVKFRDEQAGRLRSYFETRDSWKNDPKIIN